MEFTERVDDFVYFCSVKSFCLLGVFWIISLSVMPCCPVERCAEAEQRHCQESESPESAPEPCSPFYACSGCQAAVWPAAALTSIDPPFSLSLMRSFGVPPMHDAAGYSSRLLRPPRI